MSKEEIEAILEEELSCDCGVTTGDVRHIEETAEKIAEKYRNLEDEAFEKGCRYIQEKLDDVLLKDRGKTREINILTQENRILWAKLKELGVKQEELPKIDYAGLKGPTALESLRTVRYELAGLIDPSKPVVETDWVPVLTKGNRADAVCLQRAWEATEIVKGER